MSTESQANALSIKSKKSLRNRLTSQDAGLFYMAIPFILLIFVFNYLPLFGWLYAFFDYQPGVSIFNQDFAGLKYFFRIFSSGSDFSTSLRNTLVMSILGIVASPLPIVFALFLAEVRSSKLSKFIQTVSSLPNFVSWVLVFAVSFSFFSTEGFVNNVLLKLNIIKDPMNVLADEGVVWYFQTLISIWKNTGWSAIIYLASLAGIDRELYDAADVDGAGRFRKMWHVSVPGVMPAYIVMLLISVGFMLSNGFEQYYVFRNPLISQKIDVLDVYVYLQGVISAEYSYATAVGIFKSVVSIVLLFVVNLISKKTRDQSII